MNTQEFKIGQLVRCIDNSGGMHHVLTIDRIYKVTNIDGNLLFVKSDRDKEEGVHKRRFQPFKFQIGDKVTPISKTVNSCGDLDDSVCWKKAKKLGHNYLYVVNFEGNVIVCSEVEDESGDYFNESDLVPYNPEQKQEPKFSIPQYLIDMGKTVVCEDTTPAKVDMAINLLKAMGIDMSSSIIGYNSQFPHLGFYHTYNKVTQYARVRPDYIIVKTVEDFVGIFTGTYIVEAPKVVEIPKITESYKATIENGVIKVGCQTVNIEALKQLIEEAKKQNIL